MQGRADDQRELLDVESVAGHLLPEGSVFRFLAEHRRALFPDELFADLFVSPRGRPSVPADVIATVIVLQTLQGLSDRDAADAVTFDLRWKAACGLPVTAAAFHPTTLTYWRRRLAASDRPNRIFDVVRQVVAETGVLAGKTRRALDSTILDDAVATQDTVTQLIAAIRRVRRDVPGAAAVIAAECSAHDYDDPGKPAIAWDDDAARAALVDGLVRDALAVLAALPEQSAQPAADAVGLLALVAGQDVELVDDTDGTPRWRIAQRVAPDRVISVADPETRHAHKTVHRRQDGFKAHVAVEPDTGLVTDCALTKAAGADSSDAAVGPTLLVDEPAPVEVLGDSAYGSGDARAAFAAAGHTAIIKPIRLQAAVAGGFTLDDFRVDETAGTVTCPAGVTRPITRGQAAVFGIACRDCPLRTRCTTAKDGKTLHLHPHHVLLRAARRQAETVEFQDVYRQHRPMVERSLAWIVRGNRRLRFRGVVKNNAWLHHRAAAINLQRLITLGLARSGTSWAIV
ncbi:MAG TPA: IS1182 family transposase [Mycobacteriales bacterium]|nr:IS1182 family transposase [Mycobacteriales bacterium]